MILRGSFSTEPTWRPQPAAHNNDASNRPHPLKTQERIPLGWAGRSGGGQGGKAPPHLKSVTRVATPEPAPNLLPQPASAQSGLPPWLWETVHHAGSNPVQLFRKSKCGFPRQEGDRTRCGDRHRGHLGGAAGGGCYHH